MRLADSFNHLGGSLGIPGGAQALTCLKHNFVNVLKIVPEGIPKPPEGHLTENEVPPRAAPSQVTWDGQGGCPWESKVKAQRLKSSSQGFGLSLSAAGWEDRSETEACVLGCS